MKKIVIIAIAFLTIQVSAQERKRDMQQDENRKVRQLDHSEFTAEEIAQLQTKKMVLSLDLTASQQKEISKINLEKAQKHKAKMKARKERKENETKEKPTKEQRLQMANERLDSQIATKNKMKQILNAEQFEKFEKQQKRKHSKKRKTKGERKNGKKRMQQKRN